VIQNIAIENFKSLRRIDLKLGALNLFIGTNSSGKSNFLDALRVLQGIGYGFTFDEILDGKPRSASTEVWAPIRGGIAKATYSGPASNGDEERFISFGVTVQTAALESLNYRIAFSAKRGALRDESLSGVAGNIYDSPHRYIPAAPFLYIRYSDKPRVALERNRPILYQLLRAAITEESHKELIEKVIASLTNTQRIEPVPSFLRQYSVPHSVKRMGEHGENFAALVKTIISDPVAKSEYLSWLRNLTPTEVDDVLVLEGALGEPLFALKERNEEYPAPVLSDGTLRFAAIAAAFFQPDMPDLFTIEEIENGIHPTRLRLLVELLKTQAVQTGRQIIATTHSPVVLAWLSDEDYETTFFCKRDEKTGESIIKPLTAIPHFVDTVKRQPLGDLFAEGWLEGVL
jgi:energy-coupling factor transporter ATP-binding protein EcfA2